MAMEPSTTVKVEKVLGNPQFNPNKLYFKKQQLSKPIASKKQQTVNSFIEL
jgi:hypothetical protein